MASIRKTFRKITGILLFSPSEARGILLLLPLLAVAGLLIHGLGKPKSDPGFLTAADSTSVGETVDIPTAETGKPDTLFFFDPNTVSMEELCNLGFELRVAASIIKYRDAGKVFEVAEDLAMCYGVTLEQYLAVEPYIIIGEGSRRKGRATTMRVQLARESQEVVNRIYAHSPFDPNELDADGFVDLGFTRSQANTIINYRESIGGFTSVEQFGRCYAVTEDALELLSPYMVFTTGEVAVSSSDEDAGMVNAPVFPVEINSADSATLRAVSGIGEVMVVRIMDYRQKLGGFHSIGQLAEVQGMTQANYERILQQITVDSCKISKIDINFAPHKDLVARLESHPYTTARLVRKLLSVRQLKGGWSNTQELIDDKILSIGEAEKLAPYLLFKDFEKE